MPSPQNTSIIVKSIDFKYPADMDHLTEISQQISHMCRAISNLPHGSRGDDFIYLVELAISEICTNIVKHAYAHVPGDITGQVTLLHNGVQLDFFDQGEGFDPTTVPEPTADPDNLREGGYGLHIVRQIMDVVTYERGSAKGNHWHLVKLVPAK
jgi:serine/threonine-protein kinase RsbW